MPILSIVVIFHNMQREAPRTLYSLCPAYQNGVELTDYEVIAIDNGSRLPLNSDQVQGYGANFQYHFFTTDSVSPVDAIIAGVNIATGEHVAVIADGARMATPGLIWATLRGLQMFSNPFVCGLSWHLGPDIQGNSMQNGYDQTEEDRLLASVKWQEDGHRLFEISTLAPSSKDGFLGGVPPECSWFAMLRASFKAIGGFDPRFRSAGGGFVCHDFRNRALSMPKIAPVMILGEGVFHQFHGGIATNVKTQDLSKTLKVFHEEFRAIHGHDYLFQAAPPCFYIGKLPDQARNFL